MLSYIDYHSRDFYPSGNLRRRIDHTELHTDAHCLAILCKTALQVVGIFANVAVSSIANNNRHRLR
jgi:hypothetical protein